MRYRHLSAAGCALVAFVAVLGVTAFSQTNLPAESIGGPLSSAPVLGVPFSADATTTVHVILRDGTRLDQSMTDRYYRDSAGRVRIERHLEGLPAPKTAFERHFRTIVAPDPSRWPGVYTVDAETGTARLLPRSIVANSAGGNRWFDVPVGGTRFLTFHRDGGPVVGRPGSVWRHARRTARQQARFRSGGNRTPYDDCCPTRLPSQQRHLDQNG